MREYLMQIVGLLLIVCGLALSTLGVYIVAGGSLSLNYTFDVVGNVWTIMIEKGVEALVFSLIGIAVLVVGFTLYYFASGRKRLNTLIGILGSCGLIIPSLILGLGYNLVAGVVAIVIGWSWVYSIFVWLRR